MAAPNQLGQFGVCKKMKCCVIKHGRWVSANQRYPQLHRVVVEVVVSVVEVVVVVVVVMVSVEVVIAVTVEVVYSNSS